MAVFRVKRNDDGTVTIQARYQVFKGGGRRLKTVTGPRADAGKIAEVLAGWVHEQRPRKQTD